jgi:NAD(P)-dependent dehydrogenase (short-subunit alcohol dehydrogenase family)
MSLNNKVAIVTGGNSGIGQAIVLELARQHANVVIDYVAHAEATEALEQRISKLGDQSIGVEADVSKIADLQMLVDKAVEKFGRLDIMVNNAGVETRTSILDTSEDQYDKVMAINLKSAFFGTQIAARQMIKQGGGGRIVNISSVHEDWPMPGNIPYCLSRRHAHADAHGGRRTRQTQHPCRRGGPGRRDNTDQPQHDARSNKISPAGNGDTTRADGAPGGDCERRRLRRR